VSFFLDTNICIYALKGSFPEIARRLAARTPSDIKIPSMVEAELLFGAEKSGRRERTLEILDRFLSPFEIVPFCERAARHYARIRAQLEWTGASIGPNDLIIAATSMANGGTLITHNTAEFSRVDGLALEDWTEQPD
jgi:tRNA(fMet)-specific endonuclease VapC